MTAYPPGMKLRPIETWPGENTRNRRQAPFRSNLTATIKDLARELRALDPKDRYYPPSILQLALRERDFRVTDGMPRADSRPAHPGVILNIEPRNKQAMSFPCDTFTHWHDNLRAITLTLEALRKIDRYGASHSGQQYRGWLTIEAVPASVADPVQVLVEAAGDEPPDMSPGSLAELYRRAKVRAHPDRHGGDTTQSDAVEAAGDQLRRTGRL